MSNRINGARVKAAARAHASKQLRNLGFYFADHAGSATFKGQTAFASWTYGAPGAIESYRINYPALPDNAMLSRREADLIAAYTLHELGHVAFTDNHVARGSDRILFHLWNGIEDARIEHAVIVSGKARGARSMFKKLMSKYTTTHLSESFNPTSINSAAFALALVCRAAYGDGNGFAKGLLARIPAPHQAWYARAAEGVIGLPLDRSGTAGALQLAREFLDSWLAAFPDAIKKPEPEQPQSEQQQLSDEGESEDDGEDAGDDDSEEFSFGDRSDPYDDEESDDDESGGFDSGDAESEADKLAKQELEEQLAETTESPTEQGDDSLFAGADDEPEESGEGSGSGADEAPYKPVEQDQYDAEKELAPEPNIDDVFKSARERTKSAVDLPASVPPARSHMARWRNMAGKDEAAVRRAAKKLHKAALPALKAQLYRILKAPEICGWDAGAMGGRFDGKRAPRMFAGSEQVFKRRWLSEGIDTAVSIVIDMSGSMSGDSIKQAVDLAYTVAEACESARADVEVLGFRTNGGYGGSSSGTYGLDGDYHLGTAQSSATLVVAKTFKDKLSKVAHHFAFLKQCAGGGTPDYTAVKGVCEQLSQLPHQRKVVIVITDGFGEASNSWYDEASRRYRTNYSMKTLSDASYQLFGCDVIGFGIYCNPQEFADAYPIGAPVRLYDLHKTALKGVIKQLDSRDQRRVA
jgi:hypothetical protein